MAVYLSQTLIGHPEFIQYRARVSTYGILIQVIRWESVCLLGTTLSLLISPGASDQITTHLMLPLQSTWPMVRAICITSLVRLARGPLSASSSLREYRVWFTMMEPHLDTMRKSSIM